jgi:AraC-like DNA-binding protein
MDRLSLLLQRFSLSAGVFYSGQICGIHDFAADTQRGHVHLIRRGPVSLIGGRGGTLTVEEPSLLFLPRPGAHRLVANDRDGADVVCASIRFGGGGSNPITDSLPSLVIVPLARLSGAQALLELLYEEAFAELGGRQAALDRLCELLLIRLLRYCLDQGLAKGGALAGLADPRLAKALTAMFEDPTHPWELSEMADRAGMSRARFAVRFREVTGDTPADFLASWRITLAQTLLRAGRPLKHIALEVGYGSASALTRAFVRKIGQPPSRWLRQGEALAKAAAAS